MIRMKAILGYQNHYKHIINQSVHAKHRNIIQLYLELPIDRNSVVNPLLCNKRI